MTTLVFNNKDREEYLTGFHKRKEDRKKKAKEQIANKLKEEKLIVRKKRQEIAKKLLGDSAWGTFGKEECVEKNETTMDCGSDQFVTIVESEVHDPTLMGGAYMGENQPSSEEESGDEGSTPMNEDKQDKKIYIKKTAKNVAKLTRQKQLLDCTRKHRAGGNSKKVGKRARKYITKKQKATRKANRKKK